MNPKPPISDILSFSWKRTKEILFPFRLKRWFCILVIVWLAGHAAGGNANFNLPRLPGAPQEQSQIQTIKQAQSAAVTEGGEVQTGEAAGIPQAGPAQGAPQQLPVGVIIPVALIGIPLLVGISILFLWLSARFNFILLDLVVSGNDSIREGFRKFRVPGNSFFRFSLAYAALGIVALLAFGLLGALFWTVAKFFLWLMIPLGILFFLGFVLLGLVVVDFILPMMYQDEQPTMAALKGFFALKPSVGSIVLYVLIKMGLGLLTGILTGVFVIAVGIPVFLVSFVASLPGIFLYNAVAFLKPILLVLGGLAAAALIIAFVLAIGLITLPIPIFFRIFSILYLLHFHPRYNLLGYSFPGAGENEASSGH